MQAEIMAITPKVAEQWLKGSTNRRRPLRKPTVQRYARDMSEGRWKLNGQTIGLDSDGNLIDGQHRLEAVILSRTVQEFVVIKGVSPDVFSVIDIGIRRRRRKQVI